jgi:hypothetical protein
MSSLRPKAPSVVDVRFARKDHRLAASGPGDRRSFMSTASDSTDEAQGRSEDACTGSTPALSSEVQPWAASRRSRVGSEAFVSNPSSTKTHPQVSLAVLDKVVRAYSPSSVS